MKKWNKKQNRRRYYLHSKVRSTTHTVRLDVRGQMLYVPFSTNTLGRYTATLQKEFNYGVQKEIR